jgi:quercetin 2,3-dioxygenase
MMQHRSIKKILWGQPFDMGGFPIRQPLPSLGVDQIDPFLLLHHARLDVSADIPVSEQGVGPHPHRGFSPVTFLFEGGVHHRDSAGNDSCVYAGGVQWMNAGSGLIHSERPPQDIQASGGVQELIQLWINTPAQYKMDAPIYIPVAAEQMPVITFNNTSSSIRVVAGELNGVRGAIEPLFPLQAFMGQMETGESYFFPIPNNHVALLYVLSGKLQLGNNSDQIVADFEAAWMYEDGEGIDVSVLKNARFLLVTGQPLNEPVASRGPFVMNTQADLLQAFKDYQSGKMGELVE